VRYRSIVLGALRDVSHCVPILVVAAIGVACGSSPPQELNCGGCDCTETIGGDVYDLNCPPPPDPCTCTKDGVTRSFPNAGLCEAADAVTADNTFWTSTCGFPLP
jgi:hypothetical protein